MADLLDIAPSTACEVVKINGERFVVRGLHCDQIALIASRFPNIGALLAGGSNFGPQFIAQLGGAVGLIIVAGCGQLGDEARERAASNLLIEHQLKFLKAIIGLTFPNGLGSFIEELTALLAGVDEGAKPAIKVRLKTSPSPSPISSDAAFLPNLQ